MFDDDRYTHDTFERVKRIFSYYLKKEPTDQGMLRVMYMFYYEMDPEDAVYDLYLHANKGTRWRVMARLYRKLEAEGRINQPQKESV